ncbi:unnamed protein product [Heterobilharzia americana]|nr:unnamed protein product [Heterobilharzia americana]
MRTPSTVVKKPRNQYALSLISRCLDDPNFVKKHLEIDANGEHATNTLEDLLFLRNFLQSSSFRQCLTLIDSLADSNSKPIIEKLRPTNRSLRDSLQALSELWSELEEFVMRTREKDEPEAHELYDLLADIHIRELLVAYDDIANYRYVNEDFNLIPIYEDNDSFHINPEPQSSFHLNSSRDNHIHRYNDHDSTSDTRNYELHQSKPEFSEGSIESLHCKVYHSESIEVAYIDDVNISELRRHSKDVFHTGDDGIGGVQSTTKEEEDDVNTVLHHRDSSHSVQTVINRFEASDVEIRYNHREEKRLQESNHPSRTPSVDDTQKPVSPTNTPESAKQQSERSSSKSRKPKYLNNNMPTETDSNSKLNSPISSPSKTPTTKGRKKKHFHGSDSTLRSPDLNQHRHKPFRDPSIGTQSLPRNHGQPLREPRHTSGRSHRESTHHKLPQPGVPRKVHLRRDHPGEDLGITVALRTPSPSPSSPTTFNGVTIQSVSQPVISIQRILAGSLADRQGSLYPGDILLEVNSLRVHTLEQVFSQIQQTSSSLDCQLLVQAPKEGILRCGIQRGNYNSKSKRYIRCLFDYDATKDTLLPTGDVGLSFKSGDVLELVDDQDPNWWQVRSLKEPNSKARLIPSQTLEERRQAFNQEKLQSHNNRKSWRKVKTFFRAADASGLRLRSDIWSYEEVVPWPQSKVPCLLLIGPNGVGRRNLKVLLAKYEPNRFAYPITDTTDSTLPTNLFKVLSKDQMEADVKSGAYVEWGKVGGHYYGIRFSELRRIIANGKTAVLDCQPQTLHLLHQPEFNPCVVFVAAPSFEVAKTMLHDGLQANVTTNIRSDEELQSIIKDSMSMAVIYRHLYSHTLINKNMKESVEKLNRLVSKLERQPCWIPCGWAYELSIPYRSGRNENSPYIPGSSSLSALGIHDLPPSSRSSALSKSVISEASVESASRLARPPRICSGNLLNTTSRDRHPSGHRMYERHRRAQHEIHHPPIPEQDTPSESIDSRFLNKTSVDRMKSKYSLPSTQEPAQPDLRIQTPVTSDQVGDKEASENNTSEDEMNIRQVENLSTDESSVIKMPPTKPNLRSVPADKTDCDFSSTSTDDSDGDNEEVSL